MNAPEQIPNRSAAGNPNWSQIFPDADHRWVMGLRAGDAAAFFAKRDVTDAVCAERVRWLALRDRYCQK
jgi:hypothetical protein